MQLTRTSLSTGEPFFHQTVGDKETNFPSVRTGISLLVALLVNRYERIPTQLHELWVQVEATLVEGLGD